MKRVVCLILCSLFVLYVPVNVFALQYTYEHSEFEFNDTNYWVNGWCYKPYSEDEKTAILITYDKNIIKGDELTIPEYINGYKITDFADYIFQGSEFKTCDLSMFPNLSNGMFANGALEKVTLSAETKIIPDSCFLDCPIETLELPEGLETIKDYSLRGCKLKELVIPSTVKELGFQAVNCSELKKIEFKNGALTAINSGGGGSQFTYGVSFMTKSLETLIIPENITDIAYGEFMETVAGRHGFSSEKYPENLTVYGKKGSYAETYAAEHELNFAAIEVKFEPIDATGEDVISAWAKEEVKNAVESGFVPPSLQKNYKRNITRSEFTKLAMFFLSVQYGYMGIPEVSSESSADYSDNSLFPSEFMNAYCNSRNDRNGNPFVDKLDEDYTHHAANNEIKLPELPFRDVEGCTDLPFIERAYHIGIVNGISESAFNPYGEITRQEAAAMLMRVYKTYAEYNSISDAVKFSDDEQIAEWAKEDVYSINAIGVMQGVGNNVFAPLDGYTVEQAIITFWRLYDSAPVSIKNQNIKPLSDEVSPKSSDKI